MAEADCIQVSFSLQAGRGVILLLAAKGKSPPPPPRSSDGFKRAESLPRAKATSSTNGPQMACQLWRSPQGGLWCKASMTARTATARDFAGRIPAGVPWGSKYRVVPLLTHREAPVETAFHGHCLCMCALLRACVPVPPDTV